MKSNFPRMKVVQYTLVTDKIMQEEENYFYINHSIDRSSKIKYGRVLFIDRPNMDFVRLPIEYQRHFENNSRNKK